MSTIDTLNNFIQKDIGNGFFTMQLIDNLADMMVMIHLHIYCIYIKINVKEKLVLYAWMLKSEYRITKDDFLFYLSMFKDRKSTNL